MQIVVGKGRRLHALFQVRTELLLIGGIQLKGRREKRYDPCTIAALTTLHPDDPGQI